MTATDTIESLWLCVRCAKSIDPDSGWEFTLEEHGAKSCATCYRADCRRAFDGADLTSLRLGVEDAKAVLAVAEEALVEADDEIVEAQEALGDAQGKYDDAEMAVEAAEKVLEAANALVAAAEQQEGQT